MGRRLALSLPLCAALLWSRRADAMPTAKLVYVRDPGAETCPDEEELRAAVAARLGYNPFRVVADNTLFAEVRRGAPGFVADVKLLGEHGIVRGERHLTSANGDCKDISLAIALSMSIALDPLSLTRPPGTPPPDEGANDAPDAAKPPTTDAPPSPPSPQPPTKPEDHDRPPPTTANTKPELTYGVAVGGGLSFGASPDVAFAALGSIAPRYRFLSIEVGGFFKSPSSQSTSQGGSVRTTLYAGTIAGCGHVGIGFFCAKSVLGDMAASSSGVTSPSSHDSFFAAVGPRLGAAVAITNTAELRLAGDALFVATPYSLSVNDRAVYSSSPVMAVLALDGVLHFW